MFEIKKNVPLPQAERGAGGGHPRKYPWPDMAVGDMIEVPHNGNRKMAATRLRNSIAKFVKQQSGPAPRFSIRKVADTVFGVWRVA